MAEIGVRADRVTVSARVREAEDVRVGFALAGLLHGENAKWSR